MDIGKTFSFVFEDESWVSKVLIGGLIFLVPLLGQFVVLGYMIKVAQNVAQGNPRPLPEWSEFGDHLMRGLYMFVISLVYSIPLILLFGVFYCVLFLLVGTSSESQSEGVAAAGGLLSLCFIPVMLILALATTVVSYAAMARYAATNSMSEALKFREVLAAVRKSPGAWLMVLLVQILAGFVASLGLIACGIGILFTTFISYCVLGHALGQTIVSQGLAGAGPPSPGYGPPPSYGPPSNY
jgi:hypothetical protein